MARGGDLIDTKGHSFNTYLYIDNHVNWIHGPCIAASYDFNSF